MDRIIYTAMSAAKQTLDQQAVVSHNLANASTTGFRAQLMAMRAMPVAGEGLATRTSVAVIESGTDWTPGPISTTGRDLDIAMNDDAWLAVQDADGNEAYTRRGDLQVDSTGLLMSGGRPVVGDGGPVVIPLGAQAFIGSNGAISIIGDGQESESLAQIGRLKLVRPGEQNLLRGEDGLFRLPPDANGQPGVLPADDNATVTTGALEGSNVSAVESMVAMIDNARRYEMQMKVIQDSDDNAQRSNTLLSLQA